MGRKTEEKTLELSDGSFLVLKGQQLSSIDALRHAFSMCLRTARSPG